MDYDCHILSLSKLPFGIICGYSPFQKNPPQLLYTCTHENKETLGFPISQIDLRSLLAGVEGALATGRAPQQLSTRGVSTAALEVMGPYCSIKCFLF